MRELREKTLETISEYSFIVNVVDMDKDLRKDIIQNLAIDKYFKKVYNHLVNRLQKPPLDTANGIKITFLNYYIDYRIKLIYLRNSKYGYKRLYIPRKCLLVIIEQVYNIYTYTREGKLYELLCYIIYFPRIIKEIKNYISHYPTYDISKLVRYKLFSYLNLVQAPLIPLATIYINFIIGLLVLRNSFDLLLVTIDKFTKYIYLVPGKTTFTAKD